MALCTAAANRSPYVVNLIPIAEGEEDCRQGINKESLTRRKTIGFCSACYLSRSVQFAMQSSTMHMPMDWWVGEEGRRRGIPHVRYSTTDRHHGRTWGNSSISQIVSAAFLVPLTKSALQGDPIYVCCRSTLAITRTHRIDTNKFPLFRNTTQRNQSRQGIVINNFCASEKCIKRN